MKINTFLLGLLILMQSCVPKKDILYLQDLDTYSPMDLTYEKNTLQVDDILDIKVDVLFPKAAFPFNKIVEGIQQAPSLEIMKLQGYLVSPNLTINFPVLGELSVANKSTSDLELYIKNRLEIEGYLINPTVTVRLLNAKVTLLGEVNAPGTYTFTENNFTILQAIGLAGDLNINGDRKDVILIRTIDGIQTTAHLDITSADWLDGPFHNIKPNDVLVVNPNYSKIKSASFFGSASSFVAIASLIISTVVLINSFN